MLHYLMFNTTMSWLQIQIMLVGLLAPLLLFKQFGHFESCYKWRRVLVKLFPTTLLNQFSFKEDCMGQLQRHQEIIKRDLKKSNRKVEAFVNHNAAQDIRCVKPILDLFAMWILAIGSSPCQISSFHEAHVEESRYISHVYYFQ